MLSSGPSKNLIFPPTPNPEPEVVANGNVKPRNQDDRIGEHLAWVIEHDNRLQNCTSTNSSETVVVNGQDLSLAEVVAVSW